MLVNNISASFPQRPSSALFHASQRVPTNAANFGFSPQSAFASANFHLSDPNTDNTAFQTLQNAEFLAQQLRRASENSPNVGNFISGALSQMGNFVRRATGRTETEIVEELANPVRRSWRDLFTGLATTIAAGVTYFYVNLTWAPIETFVKKTGIHFIGKTLLCPILQFINRTFTEGPVFEQLWSFERVANGAITIKIGSGLFAFAGLILALAFWFFIVLTCIHFLRRSFQHFARIKNQPFNAADSRVYQLVSQANSPYHSFR
jgi:hypothetical protein